MKRLSKILLGLSLLLVGMVTEIKPVQACCTCVSVVEPVSDREWFSKYPTGTVDVVTTAIHNEINAHETWLETILFQKHILPAMQLMAEQLTIVALQQVQIVGTFFDAKHQLETQRTLQKLQAEAHKDYHPSVGMCEFGSSVKSLAASERRGEFTSILLAQRSMDRQLGAVNTSAAQGEHADKESRLKLFKKVYCNPYDNNRGLWSMCMGSEDGAPTSIPADRKRERFNKDIDFSRTVDFPWTLNIDFTNKTLDPAETDEADVFALSNNLFGHEVFSAFPTRTLVPLKKDIDKLGIAHENFLDMRSVVAKRGVAENSFNAIVGMKSKGTGGSTQYLEEILKQLGVEKKEDLIALLGTDPSYHAQMEVLTKKIFQNPQFYTNLYDKPANVSRKETALQAIGLMQKFDMFKSHLRSEASLSVLLELEVINLQRELENDLAQ